MIKNLKNTTKPQIKAFTLTELIIVLVILSIIITVAVPEYMQARKIARATQCGSAIRTIESAKQQFRRDYPGNPIITSTNEFIQRYLSGRTPDSMDPWGVGFNDSFDTTKVTTHIYNGNREYEPKLGTNQAGWLTNNGYNDAGQPTQ